MNANDDFIICTFLFRHQVSLSISDVNDNPPVFDEAVYNVSLLETTALGTMIERVLATDLDIGSNSALEYGFIDGNTDGG